MSPIVEFIGRFHPALVHLPIGILLTGLLLQVLSRRPAFAVPGVIMKWIWGAGLLSALFSCMTGYLLSLGGDYDPGLVNPHMWMGFSVAALSGFLFVRSRTGKKGKMDTIAAIGLTGLILITGHLGGSLTHGPDYLTAPFSQSPEAVVSTRKPIPDIKEAVAYADIIQPVLQAHCYSCHGPKRQKGRLRLDDSASITKGGKDGLVLHAHRPAESEMIERLLLPTEEDHHMPPRSKPPMKESEIALLQWWVAQGANFSGKVKDLPQTPVISNFLLALQAGSGSKASSLLPAGPVDPAPDKDIEALRAKGVLVLPVARNSHYLSVNFINATGVTDKDMALLLPLRRQLLWLKLGGQPIGDSALATIATCQALTVLHLNNTKIGDHGLAQLASLGELQLLNLAGTGVTPEGVRSLRGLKHLQSVFLYQTNCSSANYASLKKDFPVVHLDTGGYSVPFVARDTVNELRPKK
ncbi:MAG TPA: c-type cytochrome domain-containing protein [Puia sp.]|jgi:mono/diheme cytochrome c family protein